MPFFFPAEDNATIVRSLEGRYGKWLDGERFSALGRVEPGWVELTVTLDRLDRSFRYVMDFRAAVVENNVTEAEARDLVVDFAGYYLDQYFEGGRGVLLPLDFQPYELGMHVVYGRGDVTNPLLDDEADAILAAGVALPENDPKRKTK
jgi:hypothetical protein